MDIIRLKSTHDEIYVERDRTGYIFYYDWLNTDDKKEFLDKLPNTKNFSQCGCCDRTLTPSYIYIIESLKEAGLLSKSYKAMCCFCHILACIGFEYPDDWENPIVTVPLPSCAEEYNLSLIGFVAIYKPTGEQFRVTLRIHDVEKFLKVGRMIEDVKCVPRVWF